MRFIIRQKLTFIACGFLAIGSMLMILIFLNWYCKGRDHMVLNVPYDKVRKIIMNNGWEPVTSEEHASDGYRSAQYRDQGYVEVMGCSGTGMGYCLFVFENDKGVYLRVTTQETYMGQGTANFDNAHGAVVIGYRIVDKLD